MAVKTEKIRWALFGRFVLLEVLSPIAPVILEFMVKSVFRLGEFVLFDKTLAVSAMMLPLVSFLKSPKSHTFQRILFGFAIICGTILWTLAIVFESPGFSGPDRQTNLIICYRFSGISVILTAVILLLGRLFRDIILPIWSNLNARRTT